MEMILGGANGMSHESAQAKLARRTLGHSRHVRRRIRIQQRPQPRQLCERDAIGGPTHQPSRRRHRLLQLPEQRLQALPIVPRAGRLERHAVPQLDDRGVDEALRILQSHRIVRPVARLRPLAVLT